MGAVGGGLFHACKQLVWGPQNYKFRSAFEVCAGLRNACLNVHPTELLPGRSTGPFSKLRNCIPHILICLQQFVLALSLLVCGRAAT